MSVVRFKNPISKTFCSYTSNDSEWEVAVITGNKDNWQLCYDTDITDDVIGHLTEGEVDWVMLQVQQL